MVAGSAAAAAAEDQATPIVTQEIGQLQSHDEFAVTCKLVVDEAWDRVRELVRQIVDEEDGVFLYKLTRIAQAYPEVLQCVTDRRETLMAQVGEKLDPVRSGLVFRVQKTLTELTALQLSQRREREKERAQTDAERLDIQRRAAEVDRAHKQVEAERKLRTELRTKEVEIETRMLGELDKVRGARSRRGPAPPARAAKRAARRAR